jgi:hypothetical protein
MYIFTLWHSSSYHCQFYEASLEELNPKEINVPLGSIHVIENKGKENLKIIEIQTGSYFGEDDIIRFDDIEGKIVQNTKIKKISDSRSGWESA